MSVNIDLAEAVSRMADLLGPAIQAIRQRRDFARRSELVAGVERLQDLQEMLAYLPLVFVEPSYGALRDALGTEILPFVRRMINANSRLASMGPLNINRTIEPEIAHALNVQLAAVERAGLALIACLDAQLRHSTTRDSEMEPTNVRDTRIWDSIEELAEDAYIPGVDLGEEARRDRPVRSGELERLDELLEDPESL